ncbi:MAG: hypothetical protein RL329_2839 [Bacteroidota bacterium]|jgi:hypothetical protein
MKQITMQRIYFFLVQKRLLWSIFSLLWVIGCRLEPLPIAPFDYTLTHLDPSFDKIYLYDAVQLRNKDIIATGKVLLKTGEFDALAIRLSGFGQVKEVAHFNSESNWDDEIACMAVDSLENIYLAGRVRDPNLIFRGIVFRISTQDSLHKMWHRMYPPPLSARSTFSKIVSFNPEELTVLRGTLSGQEPPDRSAGFFRIDSMGWLRGCDQYFNYYDVKGAILLKQQVIFGGVSYGLGTSGGPGTISRLDPLSCTIQHRGHFTEVHSQFNYMADIARGADGHILAILNANHLENNQTIPTKPYYFRPYFIKVLPKIGLPVVNDQTAYIALPSDTAMGRHSVSSLIGTQDGGFIYASNYTNHEVSNDFYAKIYKRSTNLGAGAMWQTPLKLPQTQVLKIIPLADNSVLLLAGRSFEVEINRIIKINSQGVME